MSHNNQIQILAEYATRDHYPKMGHFDPPASLTAQITQILIASQANLWFNWNKYPLHLFVYERSQNPIKPSMYFLLISLVF